jgi:hypothetical protein
MKTLLKIYSFLLCGLLMHHALFSQNSHKHQSVLTYSFDQAFIIITNEFASDSALKFAPTFVTPPYETRKIKVYGPSLSVNLVPIHKTADLFFLNKGILTPLTGKLADSTSRAEPLFNISDLQVNITRNNRLYKDWQNIQQSGTRQSEAWLIKKGNFLLFNDTLQPGETISLQFRNKRSGKTLINFSFEKMQPVLLPYVAKWSRNNSPEVSHTAFSEQRLREKDKELGSIDTFYQYWPPQYSRTSIEGTFNKYSKLALYFRKPSLSYPDTSLQYALTTGSIRDIRWQTTGHLLILPGLQSGKQYMLFIRYKDNPTGIRAFKFSTSPVWYQTGRFWLTGGALLLIAALLFFFIRYLIRFRREKARSRQLTQSLQSIRAQLNPHFVFNALSSIQGLINKNDITNANHYLTGFSNLLRESLRNHDKEFVPLEKELSLLDTYIALEKLRFGFKYTTQTDHDIDASGIEIPYLLLQPVVENAIKHGAGPKNTDGSITIRVYHENADLHILVTDNGTGFDTRTMEGNGMGIRITKERIRLLNRTLHGQSIHLVIKSTTAEGTDVHLTFQNWL